MIASLFILACTPVSPAPPPAELPPEPPPSLWPAHGAVLATPALAVPEGFGVHKVVLDPGHGAPGNPGNTSSWCLAEEDFSLDVARGLAAALVATGAFEVRLARDGEATEYPERIRAADAWGAEALVSLHSDARGMGEAWTASDGCTTARNEEDPGFSVLYSDEGTEALVASRRRLARGLAQGLVTAGFPATDGRNYGDLYLGDVDHPGVYLDRHAPRKRIMMLRRPTVPSVIIETHNAWDSREAARWTEQATLDAFHGAVARGLVQALSPAS